MTKKEQGFVNIYKYSISYHGFRRLEDVYSKCSDAKWRAWRDIQRECYESGGHGLTVVTSNTMMFTAAYCITDVSTNTTTLIYHTPYSKYIIPMD